MFGRVVTMTEGPVKRGRKPMTEEQKLQAKAEREESKRVAGESAAAGTKPVVAREVTPKKDADVVQGISKKDMKKLISTVEELQAEMDSARSDLSEIVKAAVEKQHLHKAVFALVKRLNRKTDGEITEFLFQFDLYRKHMGWDDQGDLFRGQSNGSAADDDDDAEVDPPAKDAFIPNEDAPRQRHASEGFTGEDLNKGRVIGFPAAS